MAITAWIVLIGLSLMMLLFFNYLIYNKHFKIFFNTSILVFTLVATVYLYLNWKTIFI